MNRHTAYIGLGSNLGERENLVKNALRMLRQLDDIKVARTSELIETAPLAGIDQPPYINAVAEIKTPLSAQQLHQKLVETENLLGRKREGKWGSRTVDLDLLLFEDEIIQTDELTIPHPQMHLRSFVLQPLCELSSDLVHPYLKVTVGELAKRLSGRDFFIDEGRPQVICIAGIIGSGKTTLAGRLAELLDCPTIFEAYDTNPFLPKVYAGEKHLALDSQLYFLTSRAEQLKPDALENGVRVIADYIFEKELIYAKLLLGDEQLKLYEKLYEPVAPTVTRPVLVIHLVESPDVCLERIHRRNRLYEQQIQQDFLAQLASGYEQLFADYDAAPVIRLTHFDANDRSALEHLTQHIRCYTAQLCHCEQAGDEAV
ncbi:MAG: 2-amino-4-hydroxy-6-hydroxymethyldihydropteridine diphosphokinase [Sedimentisphaerales bacterium]|nr:2-amino-4-hydroxy-6-hydroxymethyldihydropteridine diphosphokinase [Sedimentisphaerales bacterium]